MKNRKNIFFNVSVVLLLFSTACNQEKERQTMIDAAVHEKVSTAMQKKIEEAKRKEMDSAIKIADSVLLLNADLWQLSMDSLGARPPRVTKPNLPTITISVDSTPVKPLFSVKK